MLAILASALAIVGASFIVGRAFLFALGRTRPTWLSGAVGFAVLVIGCPLFIHLPGRAKTTAVLVLLAVLGSLLLMRRRFFAQRPDAEAEPQPAAPRAAHATALATVAITLVLACSPFLLNDSTGVLGEGVFTNDQAAQLYWTDWLQNGDGPEPSAVRFGYPTGPQALTAATAEVTGASLEHAFNGLLVAIAIIGALAALSALGELEPRRRVAAAVITGLPYLGASYLAQSAFKETAMALLVLALAIVLSELGRGEVPRRAGIGSLIALAAASVFTYSLPGLAWFAAAIPIWIVLELIRGGGRVQADVAAGVEAVKRHRRLVIGGIAALMVVAVLGVGPVHHFFSKISDVQSSPGRLGSPVSEGEVFGIWPEGDFRIVRGDVAGSIPAILIGLLALGVGVGVALRRRQNGVLAVLAAGAIVYLATRIDASIYVQAKALAVIAPTVVFVAFAGLLTPWTEGGWPASRLVRALAVVFTVGALVSTLLALRFAPVGFDNNARQLESLAQEIQGRKVVFLGLDRFAAYWLRGTLVEAPGGYVPPDVKPRSDKVWVQGEPVDFDTMSPERLDRYRYAITTTAAFQSTPPPHMRMVDTAGPYELWKRIGKTPRQRVLHEGLAPGAVLHCNSPAGRKTAAEAGSATILPEPVVGRFQRWSRQAFYAPGSATQKLVLQPGRWQLSLQYNSQVELHVSAGGETKTLPPSLDGMYFSSPGRGAFWDAGSLTVKKAGPVEVTVDASDPPLLSRLTGARRRVWLGTLAATKLQSMQTLPLAKSCGGYVDHYVPKR
jgi:hypothetical protein